MSHPSPTAIVLVALASALAHSLLDVLPPSLVARILSRCGARRWDGFDVRMWVHSAVMGLAGALSFASDTQSAEITEPERSFRCLPPASALAWVLPAAEMGYALHDLRDALRIGNPSFIAHGALVSGFLVLAFWLRIAHHLTVIIALHISSIFLNLRRVDFGPRANAAIDVSFAVSFVLLRVLFLPVLWLVFLRHAWISDPSTWGACMHGGRVVYLAIAGGVGLHGLNAYWGWQIIKKLRSSWRDRDGVGRLKAEGHYHRSRSPKAE